MTDYSLEDACKMFDPTEFDKSYLQQWHVQMQDSHNWYTTATKKDDGVIQGRWYMWFILFDCFAKNVANYNWFGSRELQLLIHSAIYSDLKAMSPGTRNMFISGLQALLIYRTKTCSSLEFNIIDYNKIIIEAIDRIKNRNTPVVGDMTVWMTGKRFAIRDTGYE